MKVLITGGSGFIGSHVADQLLGRGDKVVIFDLNKPKHTDGATFIKGSVTEKNDVFKAAEGIDAIIHFAGILGTHETVNIPIETTMVNVIGTLNVLEAAKKFGIQVIDTSKPNKWLNPYTITKAAAESYAQMYEKEFGLKVKIICPFNVYGPRQKVFAGYQKAVPIFIVNALQNKPLPIFGDGTQTTDHIYVKDTAKAIVKILDQDDLSATEVVEIGSGEEISVLALAKKILKLTNSSSKLEFLKMRKGEDEHTRIRADISLLRDKIGYMLETPLEEGLKETIDFYRQMIKKGRIKR